MPTASSPEDRFTKIAFAVITTLIGAGVVGVWSMSNSLSRVEERVAIWTQVSTDRMAQMNTRLDTVEKNQRDADHRIGLLEGQTKRN